MAAAAGATGGKQRLFVGGLSAGVSGDDIALLVAKFGVRVLGEAEVRVKNQTYRPTRFAYLNVDADGDTLAACIKTLNGSRWKGERLRVALAKPHYLAKLKQERESARRAAEERLATSLTPIKLDDSTRLKLRYRGGPNGTLRVRVMPRVVKSDRHLNTRKRRRYCGRAQVLRNFDHPSPTSDMETKWFYEDFEGKTRGFVDTDTEEDSAPESVAYGSNEASEDSHEDSATGDDSDGGDNDTDMRVPTISVARRADSSSPPSPAVGDDATAAFLRELEADAGSVDVGTTDSDTDSDASAEQNPVAHSDTDSDVSAEQNPVAHSDTDSDVSAEQNPVAHSDTDSDVSAEQNPMAHSDTGSDASAEQNPPSSVEDDSDTDSDASTEFSLEAYSDGSAARMSSTAGGRKAQQDHAGTNPRDTAASGASGADSDTDGTLNGNSSSAGASDSESVGVTAQADAATREDDLAVVVPATVVHVDEQAQRQEANRRRLAAQEANAARMREMAMKQKAEHRLQIGTDVAVGNRLTFGSDSEQEEEGTRNRGGETVLRNLLDDSDSDGSSVASNDSLFGRLGQARDLIKRTQGGKDEEQGAVGAFFVRKQFQGAAGSKLLALQRKIGNDPRFKLDERFLEDDHVDEFDDGGQDGGQDGAGDADMFDVSSALYMMPGKEGVGDSALNISAPALDIPDPALDKEREHLLSILGSILFGDGTADGHSQRKLSVAATLFLTRSAKTPRSARGWQPMRRFDPRAAPLEPQGDADANAKGAAGSGAAAKAADTTGSAAQSTSAPNGKPAEKAGTAAQKSKKAGTAGQKSQKAGTAGQKNEMPVTEKKAHKTVFKLDKSAVQVFGRKANNVVEGQGFSVLADRASAPSSGGFTFSFNLGSTGAGTDAASGAAAPVQEPTALPPARPFAFNFGAGGSLDAQPADEANDAGNNERPAKRQRTGSATGTSSQGRKAAASREAAMQGPAVLSQPPSSTALDAASRFFATATDASAAEASGSAPQQQGQATSWWQQSRQRIARDLKRKRTDARRMRRHARFR